MSKEQEKKARPGRAVALVVLVVAFVAVGLWLATRPGPTVLQGMVDTDQIQVAAKVPGRLEKIAVAEGETVHAGQLLFVLSSPELDAKYRQMQAQQEAAQSQLTKARNGAQSEDIAAARNAWKAAEATATLAAKSAQRIDRLYKQGVVSLQKRDEVDAQATASSRVAAASRAQYDKAVAGTRPEDVKSAEALLAQARAGVEEVSSLKSELSVSSPVDGEVVRRNASVGELVPPTLPVISLFRPDNMWVSLNVPEDRLHGVVMGQKFRGEVPALDHQQVTFEVNYISPLGEFATWRTTRESGGYDVKTFEIRLKPVQGQGQAKLRPGMSVLFKWAS